MGKNYALKISLVSLGLCSTAMMANAQAPAPDSTHWPAPPRVLLKAGLRLTHFSYSAGSQTWRVVMPLSMGAEYRLSPRWAFYGQADTDLQASRTGGRRSALRNVLPSAALGLGLRYYYRQPGQSHPRRTSSIYGNYLALESNVERTELTGTYLTVSQSRRQAPTSLTPGVYAYWGTQHRLRRALLYDVNAGLGLQAPPYYNYETIVPAHYNLTAQVNLRIYWGVGF